MKPILTNFSYIYIKQRGLKIEQSRLTNWTKGLIKYRTNRSNWWNLF